MDTVKIGSFLAQLRKERGLTQEQLGEQIGVSNKTVSRWEKGNYLPPAEMLQSLSGIYGVSINEILSGQRLTETAYKEKAEENIKSALESSAFTLDEKVRYFRKKWKQDHLVSMVLTVVLLLAWYVFSIYRNQGWHVVVLIILFGYLIWRNHQMNVYVDRHAFDLPEDETCRENRIEKKMRILGYVRIVLMIGLALSILILVDLGDNLVFSMIPELNDGITLRGDFSRLFFGDDGWSREAYFRAFSRVLRLSGWLGAANLLAACYGQIMKRE